jgi:hypothetical protein
MRLSNKERERAKDLKSSLSHRMFQAAVAQSGRAGETHFICVVGALIVVGCMEHECVGVVLGLLIQQDARLADCQLRDEVRCLQRKRKFRRFLFHSLKSELGPMVGTDIFMDRLRAFLSKPVASCAAWPITTGSMVGRRPPRLL